MSAGRNDPCPCGSGKKYKKCCLVTERNVTVLDLEYRRIREAESSLIPRLFEHAHDVFGPEAVWEAWDEFTCWNAEEDFRSDNPINQLFLPYFFFSWEIDPETTTCEIAALADKTVAETFLDQHRSRLSSLEVAYLEAANRRPFTFYEVLETRPGEGMRLRDVLTEEEWDIVEREGSKGLLRGNIAFGAMIALGGKKFALALAPYLLPPLEKLPVLDLRREIEKALPKKTLNDDITREFDIELRDVLWDCLDRILNPRMPELCNTDGDPLLPHTLHFEVTSAQTAFDALKVLVGKAMTDEELLDGAVFDGDTLKEAEIPWFKQTTRKQPPGGRTVLGTLKLKDRKLTVEVNSAKRAATIMKKVIKALGPSVTFVSKVIEPLEPKLQDGNHRPKPKQEAELPPEALEVARKVGEEHWRKWYDEPVPALRNMTPREAARTREGREMLEALLLHYEHSLSENGPRPFDPDIAKIRRELRLPSRI